MPAGCKAELAAEAAKHRTRDRGPFLSYVCPETKAPLLRSSQPKMGMGNPRSAADKEFISAFCAGRKLSILDCRPKLNAVANRVTGGGYETMDHYDNSTLEFLNIPNIHRVRSCYVDMVNGRESGKDKPEKAWGALTMQLVASGRKCVDKVKDNVAVLVHCSDGWDRTAQVVSVAQIIADPFSRTIDGFNEIIQKEWCDAGHMFGLRNGHAPHNKPDQSAPIFGQFIDAIYQLVCLTPTAFEYSDVFLAFVLFHSYAQLYGDFDNNSYKERTEDPRAPSIWDCLNIPAFRARVANAHYEPRDGCIPTECGRYEMSQLICGGPLFGCCASVPLLPEAPPTAAATSSQVMSMIPVNLEEISPEEDALELAPPVDFDGSDFE